MPSRQTILKQQATRRGVFVIPAYNEDTKWFDHPTKFDVIVDSEGMLGLRGLYMSRRKAIQFAALIASKPCGRVRFYYTPPGAKYPVEHRGIDPKFLIQVTSNG